MEMEVVVKRGLADQVEHDIAVLVVKTQRIEHHLGGYVEVATRFTDGKGILATLINYNKVDTDILLLLPNLIE